MNDSKFLNYFYFTRFGVLNCYALDTKEVTRKSQERKDISTGCCAQNFSFTCLD